MSEKHISEMEEDELREELVKIRGDRAGKGRYKRKVAKVKRIKQGVSDKRRVKNVEAEESADWV